MIKSRSGAICGAAITLFLGLSAAARAEPISMLTLDYPPYAFEENGLAKGIAGAKVVRADVADTANFHLTSRDVTRQLKN
jgi:hypothetical protein